MFYIHQLPMALNLCTKYEQHWSLHHEDITAGYLPEIHKHLWINMHNYTIWAQSHIVFNKPLLVDHCAKCEQNPSNYPWDTTTNTHNLWKKNSQILFQVHQLPVGTWSRVRVTNIKKIHPAITEESGMMDQWIDAYPDWCTRSIHIFPDSAVMETGSNNCEDTM